MASSTTTSTARRHGRRPPFRSLEGPRQDDGLFGPGSMAWRVWMSASNFVAAYRSVIVQMLLPAVGAGVSSYSDYQVDPMGRLRRTGHFFSAYALADTPTVEHLSRQLYAMHKKVTGINPVSGEPFAATDHENLLYVHVTGWHSALWCYEHFNGPLTESERVQFWREASIGTELIGFPGELVPRNPDEVRNYFNEVNPHLCYSRPAMDVIEWFKEPWVVHTRDSYTIPAVHVIKAAAVPTLPDFVQRMTGLRQSRARSIAATVGFRALVTALDNEPGIRANQFYIPEAHRLVMSARRRQAEWERTRGDDRGLHAVGDSDSTTA